jgi:hypothetical protein
MDADLKKTLKAVTLELRHLLEGRYDQGGQWKPGDLERRLAAIGVRRDRASVPVDELGHLAEEDRQARKVVDAYLRLRDEASVEQPDAVAEFVRETAYTWANRLLALRCMEARELIDPVVLQQEAYGGRSLEHHRFAQRHPELCAGDDDGLFAVLDNVFREQAERLPMLFDPQAPGIALRPAPAALKDCFGLLSLNADTLGKYRIRVREDESADANAEPPNPFTAPDALGWAYQYWNTEEKDRVFEKVRTVKGAKIAGADIVPATQLYTEDYMVKFLVQNSLGATWMGMHPESNLAGNWEYYVKDADRAPVEKKAVREITFLDPACGSGHFLLEAFDLYYAMYLEEGELSEPHEICDAILTQNLFGIDIDARSVQIAEVALWMKAAERAFDYKGAATNLVAATASHLKGEAWEQFLAGFAREPSVARVLRKFAQTMEHIDEIGSLARPAEELREIIQEEHATWERQLSERKEANFLFPELNADALSGQLPFQEISDEEFGDRLFYRARAGIDAFTKRARETGEFDDQMLANETRAGFRLVDLLSLKYDVVAANPPWMGPKNMGAILADYICRAYVTGSQDAYAAFILRCQLLTHNDGRIAMVTQQSWLFLKSFAPLRAQRKGGDTQDYTDGVLVTCRFELLVQLGRYAFSELGNGVIQPLLFVALNRLLSDNTHKMTCFRLSAPRPSNEQDLLLKRSIAGDAKKIKTCPRQARFLKIPLTPVCFWLRDRFFDLLERSCRFESAVRISEGAGTRDESRFLRMCWECSNSGVSTRWWNYAKGGGFSKWLGFELWMVDWEHGGARVRSSIIEKYPYLKGNTGILVRDAQYFGTSGLSYSDVARGSLSVRLVDNAICSDQGPGIYTLSAPREEIAALLNARLHSYLLRALTPNPFHMRKGYVYLLPLPSEWTPATFSDLRPILATTISLKSELLSCEIDNPRFRPVVRASEERLVLHCLGEIKRQLRIAAALHSLEGVAERKIFEAYRLGPDEVDDILDETGTVTGWFPLIEGHEDLPAEVSGLTSEICAETPILKGNGECLRQMKVDSKIESLKRLFAEGPDSCSEPETTESEDQAADETLDLGARVLIPPQSFLEQLAQRVELHPVSVFSIVNRGIEELGWRCAAEEAKVAANECCFRVLEVLGHRWPSQIEAGELVPEWVNADGIVPLMELANEPMLFERVEQRFRADKIDTSDFGEVMGKPLDTWLTTEFFKHHTKQFKKRPIAWQLQCGKFTTRTAPAFACLLYYQKLDADTLPKLRSQYVSPLRQRLETEQRGIVAVAADARSDRQVKRQAELEDAILELQKFDTGLETVARNGFGGSVALMETRRQYAIDDALLSLKARWLRRLSELIGRTSLNDWLDAAEQTDLHPAFSAWIAEAMSHLDYFCSRVSPPPPKQETVKQDPTGVDRQSK